MHKLLKSIPMTGDMVSLWLPSGQNRAIDIIRGNHGQCYGTHPNVPTIAPPIDQINACDATTDWTGTALTIDTDDEKEGSDCLVDTVAAPTIDTYYNTYYYPTGSWNWSAKEHILFWFKCDRASTAFTVAKLVIYDTSANWRVWYLSFLAGEWTAMKCLLSTGDVDSATLIDLSLINYVLVSFYTADTTTFYKKINDVRVTGKPSLINPSVGWHFDGTNDYVDLGTGVGDYTDNFTLGGWIKTFKSSSRIMSRRTIALTQYDFYIDLVTRTLRFHDGNNYSGLILIDDDKWHFCIASINGLNSRLYIDAVADGAIFNPTITSRDVKFLIGAWNNGVGNPMDGNIALSFVAKEGWSQQQVESFYLGTRSFFSPRG